MKKLKLFLFFVFIIAFLLQQILIIKFLIKSNSFDKFFTIIQKIEKIINDAYSYDDNFNDLQKDSKCAIFKIPSINKDSFIIKDTFDTALILFNKNTLFFNLIPDLKSARKSQSVHFKNIKNIEFRYIGNTFEFLCSINDIDFSFDFFINKGFLKISFYDKRVF